MIEIIGNFNMLEYLKSIKELWEAKSVYEQTVVSLTNQYNKLGRQKTYNNRPVLKLLQKKSKHDRIVIGDEK